MDKMKEFLLKNKGCPMTPAATKQLLVKFIEWLQEQGYGELDVQEVISQLESPVIKYGHYIQDENRNYVWIEDIPEDYSGFTFFIADDGINDFSIYENGIMINSLEISPTGVNKISAENGTPNKVYGEDVNGNLVKGVVSGGTVLYRHTFKVSYDNGDEDFEMTIINNSSTPFLLNNLNIKDNKPISAMIYADSSGMPNGFISYYEYDSNNDTLYLTDASGSQNSLTTPAFINTDTVTPL